MMMDSNIPSQPVSKLTLLKMLELCTDSDGNGVWCVLDIFVKWLRNITPLDTTGKPVRKYKRADLITEFRRTPKFWKQDHDLFLISYEGVLTYVCKNSRDIPPFYAILQELARYTVTKHNPKHAAPQSTNYGSVRDLYINISQASLIPQLFISMLDLSYLATGTLHEEYKQYFSAEQWMQICLFEHHFDKQFGVAEYDKSLGQKWNMFTNLSKLKGSLSPKYLTNIASEQKTRKSSSIEQVKIEIGGINHSAGYIESTLMNHHQLQGYLTNIAFCDCVHCCNHAPGAHIYAEVSETTPIHMYSDLTELIASFLSSKHGLSSYIALFPPASFDDFIHGDNVSRFLLRDAITHGIFNHQPLYIHSELCDLPVIESGGCKECLTTSTVRPLDMLDWSLIDEWLSSVPLIFQVMCYHFVNWHSVARSSQPEKLIMSKVQTFYCIFDTFMNAYNRHHLGIIQEKNTWDLAMNYRSVSSVFDITSSFGVTSSLKSADRKLKHIGSEENSYYNTFIRQHKLEYNSIAGQMENSFSLRKGTISIFLLDNLVRLRFHADPNPSEHRSHQMCALPITIKGIPMDHSMVAQWHDASCNNLFPCSCMQDIPNESVQFGPSEDEKRSFENFEQLMTCGFPSLWQAIYKGPLWNHVACNNHVESRNESDIDDTSEEMTFKGHQTSDSDGHGETMIYGKGTAIYNPDSDVANNYLRQGDTLQTTADKLEPIRNNFDDQCVDRLAGHAYEGQTDECQVDEGWAYEGHRDIPQADDSQVNESGQCAGDAELSRNFASVIREALLAANVVDIPDLDVSFIQNHDQTILIDIGDKNETWYRRFQISHFQPMEHISLHPFPATGRDDDWRILQKILDDTLVKLNFSPHTHCKILCAPDHKIGKNILLLRSKDVKYEAFLPDFPVLHLRKSKITNLLAGYKDAALIHIIKYMRDENTDEWTKLLDLHHIDKATRHIRRVSLGLHGACVLTFIRDMDKYSQNDIIVLLQSGNTDQFMMKYYSSYVAFLKEGCANSKIFAFHCDLMKHCDEVCGISLAERMGGPDGYTLLLGAVWSSLPFAFLNGSSAYASFCSQLLSIHNQCGTFYKKMKANLFSLPYKDGTTNQPLDAHREMDHLDIIKAYRAGSDMSAVLPRLASVDFLTKAHRNAGKHQKSEQELLGIMLSQCDIECVSRVIDLVMRCGAFSDHAGSPLKNIYAKEKTVVLDTILDSLTYDIGFYLMKRLAHDLSLFHTKGTEAPSIENVQGPADLIQRVKQQKSAKSVTIRRVTKSVSNPPCSDRQAADIKHQKIVQKEKKILEKSLSKWNTCQAFAKPDCSKFAVNKADGIQKALFVLLDDIESRDGIPLYEINFARIPDYARNSVKVAAIELAGVKFKCNASNGEDYLQYLETYVFNRLLSSFPSVTRIGAVEEKYMFTPDDFKSAARLQRDRTSATSISHLKTSSEIIAGDKLDRACTTSTVQGKTAIGTYLAKNITSLHLQRSTIVDIDSDLIIKHEDCCNGTSFVNNNYECCNVYSQPLMVEFSSNSVPKKELSPIKQRKGEGEMAVADWLFYYKDSLSPGEACLSVITSGDIDAIPIHMFFVSRFWPRGETGRFLFPVYVVLDKTSGRDIYNITGIVEQLEDMYDSRYAGLVCGCCLCLGGNDFLPKYHRITHSMVITGILQTSLLHDMFVIDEQDSDISKLTIDRQSFMHLFKYLFAPKKHVKENVRYFTYAEVRDMSIKVPKLNDDSKLRDPSSWMPPQSVAMHLCSLIDSYLDYLMTVGKSDALLPNFAEYGVLKQDSYGNVEYNFGPDVYIADITSSIVTNRRVLYHKMSAYTKKRKGNNWSHLASTPRKKTPRKKASKRARSQSRSVPSTPSKCRSKKRLPYSSTPK